MILALPRHVRVGLRLVEASAWAVALAGTAYVLWAAVMLQVYTPPTPSGVLEVLRYGRVTTVSSARPLPETGNDVHRRARKYAREGLVEEAAECYRYLLRLTPDDAECNQEYGELLFRRGELAPARRYFERVLQLRPDDFYAHVYMARILFGLGRPEEALRHAQEAHGGGRQPAETRELAGLYRSIGNHYFEKGRWDDAVALFNRADPERRNDEVQFLLARSFAEKGRSAAGLFRRAGAALGLASPMDAVNRAEALARVARCLELNPLHEGARRLRATLVE